MPKKPPIYDGRFVLRPEQDTSYVPSRAPRPTRFNQTPRCFPA